MRSEKWTGKRQRLEDGIIAECLGLILLDEEN